ncbi:hypothetical protein KY290_010227 [Solanum tuberosum]|uniref:Uncharacterized protein n=1 Tax=Solanum tuberosum TaxID=4113 RepID=A0ABQ7VXV1_SOLTU|nr:hypothetical protein KY289_010612 [Solanum tuberosum]KAH0773090.1 hypothetical protein KY290_010227 [Solanum tuberosum]
MRMVSASKKQREEEEMDFSDAMVVMYADAEPIPIQIDSSSQEGDIEANATKWIQENMISLSLHFGMDLKGCKKEAYALLMNLDQRTRKDKKTVEGQRINN